MWVDHVSSDVIFIHVFNMIFKIFLKRQIFNYKISSFLQDLNIFIIFFLQKLLGKLLYCKALSIAPKPIST